MTDPAPVLNDDALYFGDNGRVFCGKCSGASARFTGRDISGQKVERVTAQDQAYAEQELGMPFSCEQCNRNPDHDQP